MCMPKEKQKIIIYKSKTGPKLEVSLKNDTVWLTQKQMANLFDKNVRTVNEHVVNIFKEDELKENSVVRKFRITASDGKKYNTNIYNLDVIISVGYRVKSLRGTEFRIWATKTLRKYITDGIVLNEKRLKDRQLDNLSQLEGAIKLLQQTIQRRKLKSNESKALLSLITDYTNSWILLQKYDEDKLKVEKVTKKKGVRLVYEDVYKEVLVLKKNLIKKKQATSLFAQERDHGLDAILGNIYQTFGGKDLYSSLEEKAAHLLYFVIKDHPFSDGNKRTASFLFILFLMKNNCLYNKKGEKKINDNALVALALLVAESDPKQKDLMVRLIVNLINNK
jgi:death-on-curing family protein